MPLFSRRRQAAAGPGAAEPAPAGTAPTGTAPTGTAPTGDFTAFPSPATFHETDPWLPPLTRVEAIVVRGHVLAQMEALGHPALHQSATRIESSNGAGVDLPALVTRLAGLPPADQIAAIDEILGTEVGRFAVPPVVPPGPVLVSALVPATAAAGAGYSFALAPDLHVCVAELRDRTLTVVADPGVATDAARSAPLVANLTRLPAPDHHRIEFVGGGTVELFTSDDPLGASRLLVVDDLLDAARVHRAPGADLLVAVPHVHSLAVHVVTDATAVSAQHGLVDYVARVDPRLPALSPHVYLRTADGALHPVTTRHADGTMHPQVTPELVAALARVGAGA